MIWATLLRAPTGEYAGMVPDDTSSQHGHHEFGFALLPYQGSWSDGGVIELGQDLNVPVTCAPIQTAALANEGPLIELSPPTVVLSGIKLPEDGTAGEVVVRMYEATGKAGRAELRVKGAVSAWQSDLREGRGAPLDCRDGTIAFDIGAFEIATIRVLRR
jgi:alpha-mannosidase